MQDPLGGQEEKKEGDGGKRRGENGKGFVVPDFFLRFGNGATPVNFTTPVKTIPVSFQFKKSNITDTVRGYGWYNKSKSFRFVFMV